ncbi:nuclear pore complex protein Nup205 [Dermacentor variabilis]|uniref:nuclear pore complex protein Nup205 n=1 Tax=Dermacentor variabilis TaxID=34621 RepID=UPI003F5C4329
MATTVSSTGPFVNMSSSSLWTPYKDLQQAVEAVLVHRDVEAVADFVAALRRHRRDFAALLVNPARCAQHRDAVSRAPQDGIAVSGKSTPQLLPQDVVGEALLLSEMFDLNELASLELVLAAQQQLPLFPELTRGLVAVLLYYDGRRALVNALRTLVQVTEGRTWTVGLNADVLATVTKYTNGLRDEDGVLARALQLLDRFDYARELDMLQRNRALGPPRYRRQVLDMIQETQQSLAEVVFCWACQTPLSKSDTLAIVRFLSQRARTAGDGALDSVSLTLLMALFYALDTTPLFRDADLALALHREFTASQQTWKQEALFRIAQFAWALSLRASSQLPAAAGLESELTVCLEEDERLVDIAIEAQVFSALRQLVVLSPLLHREEFFLKKMHTLLADFVALMPLKLKELRNQGDEAARIISTYAQNGQPPPVQLPRHFEQLLELVAELYSQDPLELRLAEDFWVEAPEGGHRRQLAKFVRLAGDLLQAPLFVPYVSALSSLARSRTSAQHCFQLLKSNGHLAGSQWSPVSWEHFLGSMRKYFNCLHPEGPPEQYRAAQPVTALELRALVAMLKLMETVVQYDELARLTLADHPHHSTLALLAGLISCAVPPELKAALLRALAAFATAPELTPRIWQLLVPCLQGLRAELDEIESRNEEFPITAALLVLLAALLDHPPVPGTTLFLEHVREAVFLRLNVRAYRHATEKWQLAAACLKVLGKPCVEVLLLEYLEEGGALSLLLHLLDEAAGELGDPAEASLCALQLIEQALQLPFRDRPGCSLHRLLLTSTNPRTQHPDCARVLATYVTHGALQPRHALSAARILLQLCMQPSLISQVETAFRADRVQVLMHGFAEAIEVPSLELPVGHEDTWSPDEVRAATAGMLLQLLLVCLQQQPPEQPGSGLAQLLLLGGAEHTASLQEPGVGGQARTCLHALLALLERPPPHRGSSRSNGSGALLALGYQLLWALCIRPACGGDTAMRFLRSSRDFFTRHLELLPSWPPPLAQAWFVRLLALELRLAAKHGPRSHGQRLVRLLLLDRLLLRMLDGTKPPPSTSAAKRSGTSWDLLETSQVESLLSSLEQRDPLGGPRKVDVAALHQRLLEDSHALLAVNSKERVQQEVKAVLQAALERNAEHERAYVSRQAFNAWQQLSSVLVVCWASQLDAQLLLELAHELLVPSRTLNEQGPAAELLLLIVAALRQGSLTTTDQVSPTSILALTRSLLQSMVVSGSGQQRLRAHLYAALQHLLLGWRGGSGERVALAQLVQLCGQPLRQLLCRDATASHEVTQMLALCVLDAMVSLDARFWLEHLARDGYLPQLVVASPAARPHLREARLALLMRIAASGGARTLLEAGLDSQLSASEFLRSDMLSVTESSSKSALRLLLALSATLGPRWGASLLVTHREVLADLLVQRDPLAAQLVARLGQPPPLPLRQQALTLLATATDEPSLAVPLLVLACAGSENEPQPDEALLARLLRRWAGSGEQAHTELLERTVYLLWRGHRKSPLGPDAHAALTDYAEPLNAQSKFCQALVRRLQRMALSVPAT